MKSLKILVLFIVVLSGCSKKYVDPGEEELFGEEFIDSWKELGVKVVEQDEEYFSLNCQIKDIVEVKDSFNLSIFEQQDNRIRKNKAGIYKLLGGCAIGGCTFLASSMSALSWMNDPSDDIFLKLAWGYGIVGGIGALYFIISGLSEFNKSDRAKPYYIRKNIICTNTTPLRDNEVKIMLKNTSSEKMYYTDKDGNLELKFAEIIPEPTDVDSIINLIVQYENLVDTVNVKIKF